MFKQLALILVSPLNQAILILAIACLIVWARPHWKKRYRSCLFASAMWLYLCSQYFFSYILIAPLENYAEPIKLEDMRAHNNSSIFVLACYYYDAADKPLVSQWNDCSLRRLVQASLMYKAQPQPILLTGGDFSEFSDAVYADAAKAFLIELGVPGDHITAINTNPGTKAEVFALQQNEYAYEHYYVVSSATHSFRLSFLMNQAGMTHHTLFPVHHYNVKAFNFEPSLPSVFHLQRSQAAFYEYAAIVKMWLEL